MKGDQFQAHGTVAESLQFLPNDGSADGTHGISVGVHGLTICAGDSNNDGVSDFNDLNDVLSNWECGLE